LVQRMCSADGEEKIYLIISRKDRTNFRTGRMTGKRKKETCEEMSTKPLNRNCEASLPWDGGGVGNKKRGKTLAEMESKLGKTWARGKKQSPPKHGSPAFTGGQERLKKRSKLEC